MTIFFLTVALALDSQILKDKLVPISQYDQKPNLIISHNDTISTISQI